MKKKNGKVEQKQSTGPTMRPYKVVLAFRPKRREECIMAPSLQKACRLAREKFGDYRAVTLDRDELKKLKDKQNVKESQKITFKQFLIENF